ncbi:IS3 family transposase [Corynebacterium macginleyi]|uniref:IS3 family transposase n=1 Tax=Corynebacterium macginleyi TaxID=38290 RepID=UPI00190E51D1|nr:IS3 family transposase [Corynebacterium macginleyi]
MLKRIAASLKEDTAFTPVNHKKVARIMKSMGLQGLYQASPMHHYQAQAWSPRHARSSRPQIHS